MYVCINEKKKRETPWDSSSTSKGDDTMAYTSTSSALVPSDLSLAQPDARAQRNLFRRLFDAIIVSRQKQADREIARYITRSGGKITDEVEREIERRFLSNPTC